MSENTKEKLKNENVSEKTQGKKRKYNYKKKYYSKNNKNGQKKNGGYPNKGKSGSSQVKKSKNDVIDRIIENVKKQNAEAIASERSAGTSKIDEFINREIIRTHKEVSVPLGEGEVEIKFVGRSSDEVTGSMVLVKSAHRQVLIECGLYQNGNDVEDEYSVNSEKFDFNPRELNYIFVCHNHTDHLGLVPRLFKEKTFANVIMPKDSFEVAEILMKDCAKIMSYDARELSKIKGEQCDPIYTPADVEYALKRTLTYPIGDKIVLDEYITFRFVPSGHILNACQLELFITEDGITKKILYTSDLGNVHIKKDFAQPFSPVQKADIVIGESTYGNCNTIANENTRKADIDLLRKTIDDLVRNKKGTILVPVFANDRCQVIMTELYRLYGQDKDFKLGVYVDSPMAANICDVYYDTLDDDDYKMFEKVCDWKNMNIVYTSEESKKLFAKQKSKIVLASSGMLDQGRAKQWFEKICNDKNSYVVFCGYSVEGTLASKVKTMLPEIEHEGKKYNVRCHVVSLSSYSSHMQQDSLIKYYSGIHTPYIYLVHGDIEARKHLAKVLNKKFKDQDKERQAVCASKGLTVRI